MPHYHGYYKTHEGYILSYHNSSAFLKEEIMVKETGLY